MTRGKSYEGVTSASLVGTAGDVHVIKDQKYIREMLGDSTANKTLEEFVNTCIKNGVQIADVPFMAVIFIDGGRKARLYIYSQEDAGPADEERELFYQVKPLRSVLDGDDAVVTAFEIAKLAFKWHD